MGAHHAETADPMRTVRAAGQGVLVASAALALTGAGAGLASATESYDGSEDAQEDSGSFAAQDAVSSVDGASSSDLGASDAGSCDDSSGLLGGLGLLGLSGGECDDDSVTPSSSESAPDTAQGSSSGTGSTGTGSSDPNSAATGTGTTGAAPAGSTNPQDAPPAPGQTKMIPLPSG